MARDAAMLVEVADPAVGLPSRVSPSQVSTFGACGLRYYFTSILGWREPPQVANTTGEIVHDALEALYRLPGAERTSERATQLLQASALRVLAQPAYEHLRHHEEVATKARAAMANAFRIEDPPGLDVDEADLETALEAELGGVPFGGRLDRRTRRPLVRISDYKSGKRPAPAYLEGKLRQLYLYAAAALAAGEPVDEIELLFLGAEPARVRRPVYPAVIDDTVAGLVTMRANSQTALNDLRFTARPSPLCKWCPFQRVCPTKGNGIPTPGSEASNAVLEQRGLHRRDRGQPLRLEVIPDTEEAEVTG